MIQLHCGNPSKNLSSQFSYFEVFKSIFRLCLRRAKQRHRSWRRWAILWATIDERRGVMLEFKDLDREKFAQLVTDAPQWTEWMA
ncbi:MULTISPECIES: hypothetical protein [Nostoc]|uniref:Uncharacterized protein n=2 Tax=Nostoc TaxID=1177 RepID=A0ABR8IHI0_9NOSO|nr:MULTISPECIES: hypothetical protein [Nostoc]MBD2563856.1 hypothetical protein [Nostoc linckia FACHB-391]MBD2651054.1 hypothetical protein [Nostoc foliaceum FACHB-393]